MLEGSGVWPDRVAELGNPRIAALWLTASSETLRQRIYSESFYGVHGDREKVLVDKFVARTALYDQLMLKSARQRGLTIIDVDAESAPSLLRHCHGLVWP